MLTRCPGCRTVFDITEDEYAQADGAVQCGECGTQFHAGDEALTQEDPPEPVEDAPATATESEPEEDFAPELPEAVPETPPAEFDAAPFTLATPEFIPEPPAAEDETPQEASPPVDDADSSEPAATGIANPQPPEDTESPAEGVPPSDDTASGEQSEVEGEPEAAHAPPEELSLDLPEPEPAPPAFAEVFQREFETASATPRRRTWPWLIGLLLALIALGAQVAWRYRDVVAAQPFMEHPWAREARARLCARIDCALPQRTDVQSVLLLARDIRRHPVYDNVLVITVTIENQASFEQPYPLLRLAFSDRSGAVIGQRDFTPAEYLGPAAEQAFRPEIPVHGAIEILDPGPQAESYSFDFIAAQNLR